MHNTPRNLAMKGKWKNPPFLNQNHDYIFRFALTHAQLACVCVYNKMKAQAETKG